MSNLDKRYTLKLDTKSTFFNPTPQFSLSDNETSDMLIRVTNNNKLIDMKGIIVVMVAIDPNGIMHSDFVELQRAEEGLLYCNLNQSLKNVDGTWKARLMCIYREERIVTSTFSYKVNTDEFVQLNQDVMTDDRFGTLTQMLSRLSTIELLETNRQEAENSRVVSENNRLEEFEVIKEDYNTYKNVMISESNVAALQKNINDNSSQIKDIENDFSSQIQETVKMKRSLINDRGIQDSIFSVNNSRIGYEDTQETIFTENWNDISQWKTQTIAGVQVSNNNLFSTGLQGGGSGANHSYKINDNENLRAVFKVNLNTFPKNGGVMIGVSNDEAGTVPKNAGGSVFALYLSGGGNANSMNLGVQGSTAEGLKYTTGEYIITVTVDKKYISIVASKTDNMLEISCRRLREGFNINNLYIFNSDENALSGISIGLCSARKGLQMIKPNSYGENIAKSVQWTGDGTQSFRIYLPKDYDSRKPSPLVICFHGNGTSEINWSTGFGDNNYGRLQRTLTENGYIVLGCSLNSSTTTWGNKLSTNAYYQAYKYVRDNYSIGSVVIFANSMGGIESLNAIAENKIPCVAWAGTVPVFNLKNVYQNSLFTNGIKGAYEISSNGSDYDIKTEGRDPNLMSGYAFRGIPMWVASPDDDDKVSKFENTDKLIEKVKDISIDLRVISVPNGMGGHSFNIQPYLESIIAFFNEYVMS